MRSIPRTELPFPQRISSPATASTFYALSHPSQPNRLWWDQVAGRLYFEETCNGPSTWSYFQLPTYRSELMALAALCAAAGARLCPPVSEQAIIRAKSTIEPAIDIMRSLVEEDREARRLQLISSDVDSASSDELEATSALLGRARGKLDYSDWLTPENLAVEEAAWAEAKFHERYGAGIRTMLLEYPCASNIVEYGCGTGLVPQTLDDLPIQKYTLVDGNSLCMAAARERNKDRPWVWFMQANLRTSVTLPGISLACSFAVLKHFSLEELPELFVRLFGAAEFALFTVAIAPTSVTDDAPFTHVRVSEEALSAMLFAAGHVELWRDNTDPEEPLIATRRTTPSGLRTPTCICKVSGDNPECPYCRTQRAINRDIMG